MTSPQVNLPPLIVHPPPSRTELDKEWETFNDLINNEGQSIKTPESNVQIVNDIVTETISNVSEMEHIPITPSSKLMLKIEEIPPLDVFYSPRHKAVVRRKRKKRKLESILSHDAEQLDILWQGPNTYPTENITKLSQIVGEYSSVTIDKASEVQHILKEKEDQIQVFQQNLQHASANNET